MVRSAITDPSACWCTTLTTTRAARNRRKKTLKTPHFGRGRLQHAERGATLGRREGAVERGEIVGIECEVDGAAVVADMLERRRLGDHDHTVLPQQPRERNLRRTGAVPCGDFLQRPVAENAALLERGIGHDRNPA